MKDIKVGDILYGMWHYSMHFPVWFRVTKVTDKRAEAERLCSCGGGQQGYEWPNLNRVAESRKHYIKVNAKDGRLETGSWKRYDHYFLEKWDNQPIWADHMD